MYKIDIIFDKEVPQRPPETGTISIKDDRPKPSFPKPEPKPNAFKK